MHPNRWRQIDAVLLATPEREPSERPAYLEQACAGDEDLKSEVQSLLSTGEEALSLIDAPAFEAAAGWLSTPIPELAEGELLAHYHILSLLGAGGMGEVYLAEDTELGRQVAIKLLPAKFTRNKERLRRFRQEARAASGLNHPNILTIHQISQIGNRNFMATEFVAGQTLRQLLTSAPTALSQTLDIAIQIASALTAAHQAGIVHRDIKPENIMLRQDGYVKVLDFGLAKLTEQQEPTTPMRTLDEVNISSGLVMGTVRYMSPEQARGEQVDARSDIFSFGVLLYEMVAGHTPFGEGNSNEMISAILKKDPPALIEAPGQLQRIVSRALLKTRQSDIRQRKICWQTLRR